MKKIIKSLIPPIVFDGLKKLRKPAWRYSGDYPSWEDAEKDSGGYDAPQIAAKVLAATEKVISGEAVFERDSMLFYEEEYNIPLLLALYRIAIDRGRLHVLDFGGALGSVFRQHRKLLQPVIRDISWSVVEQESFFDVSKQISCENELHFYRTVSEALKNEEIDVFLFSSVLQYVKNAEDFIDMASVADYIIIDRHPVFCHRERAQITVQKVSEPIYEASYPLKIYGKNELEKIFENSHEILSQWQSKVDCAQVLEDKDNNRDLVIDAGMILKKR